MHTGILDKKGFPMPRESLHRGAGRAGARRRLGGAWHFPGHRGASALIVFTIAANVLYHNFLGLFTGDERMPHFNSVMTNLALIGGFLLVIAISW